MEKVKKNLQFESLGCDEAWKDLELRIMQNRDEHLVVQQRYSQWRTEFESHFKSDAISGVLKEENEKFESLKNELRLNDISEIQKRVQTKVAEEYRKSKQRLEIRNKNEIERLKAIRPAKMKQEEERSLKRQENNKISEDLRFKEVQTQFELELRSELEVFAQEQLKKENDILCAQRKSLEETNAEWQVKLRASLSIEYKEQLAVAHRKMHCEFERNLAQEKDLITKQILQNHKTILAKKIEEAQLKSSQEWPNAKETIASECESYSTEMAATCDQRLNEIETGLKNKLNQQIETYREAYEVACQILSNETVENKRKSIHFELQDIRDDRFQKEIEQSQERLAKLKNSKLVEIENYRIELIKQLERDTELRTNAQIKREEMLAEADLQKQLKEEDKDHKQKLEVLLAQELLESQKRLASEKMRKEQAQISRLEQNLARESAEAKQRLADNIHQENIASEARLREQEKLEVLEGKERRIQDVNREENVSKQRTLTLQKHESPQIKRMRAELIKKENIDRDKLRNSLMINEKKQAEIRIQDDKKQELADSETRITAMINHENTESMHRVQLGKDSERKSSQERLQKMIKYEGVGAESRVQQRKIVERNEIIEFRKSLEANEHKEAQKYRQKLIATEPAQSADRIEQLKNSEQVDSKKRFEELMKDEKNAANNRIIECENAELRASEIRSKKLIKQELSASQARIEKRKEQEKIQIEEFKFDLVASENKNARTYHHELVAKEQNLSQNRLQQLKDNELADRSKRLSTLRKEMEEEISLLQKANLKSEEIKVKIYRDKLFVEEKDEIQLLLAKNQSLEVEKSRARFNAAIEQENLDSKERLRNRTEMDKVDSDRRIAESLHLERQESKKRINLALEEEERTITIQMSNLIANEKKTLKEDFNSIAKASGEQCQKRIRAAEDRLQKDAHRRIAKLKEENEQQIKIMKKQLLILETDRISEYRQQLADQEPLELKKQQQGLDNALEADIIEYRKTKNAEEELASKQRLQSKEQLLKNEFDKKYDKWEASFDANAAKRLKGYQQEDDALLEKFSIDLEENLAKKIEEKESAIAEADAAIANKMRLRKKELADKLAESRIDAEQRNARELEEYRLNLKTNFDSEFQDFKVTLARDHASFNLDQSSKIEQIKKDLEKEYQEDLEEIKHDEMQKIHLRKQDNLAKQESAILAFRQAISIQNDEEVKNVRVDILKKFYMEASKMETIRLNTEVINANLSLKKRVDKEKKNVRDFIQVVFKKENLGTLEKEKERIISEFETDICQFDKLTSQFKKSISKEISNKEPIEYSSEIPSYKELLDNFDNNTKPMRLKIKTNHM